jgi:uridine kinase
MHSETALKGIILDHARRYPRMEVVDAVKLVYQNEFGGGHLIADEALSLRRLEQEYAATPQTADAPLYEDIGGDQGRFHLCALDAHGIAVTTLNKFFIESAKRTKGSAASMEKKLASLHALCAANELPFGLSALEAFLCDYKAKGTPQVSHSPAFREAYRPAYRVVRREYAFFAPLFAAIDATVANKGLVRVGIDGRCASGKSTLADLMAAVYGANVVRMDDFFLPPALRTQQRLGEPGGNVHYERFIDEVLRGLIAHAPFTHRVFDCSVMDYVGEKHFTPTPVTLVEGSYSLRPDLRQTYDLAVFLTVDEGEQARRIRARDGEVAYEQFRHRWIPMEERYFAAFHVEENSDLVFDCSPQPQTP